MGRGKGDHAWVTGGGAWPGPRVQEGLTWAAGETRLTERRRVGLQLEPRAGAGRGRQGRCPAPPPGPAAPSRAGSDGVYLGPRPRPSPTRGTHPSRAGGWGRTAEAGGHELRRGPRAWERVTSGLYHGGGGGGGPGPGVCGSPPRSRARRFHFPGCPGVNIRVSGPLPPRRAAATFLPRPGRARARPHAAGSRPMSAQGRGDRQVWSAARGGGAPKGEVRGGACERGGAGRGGWRGGRVRPRRWDPAGGPAGGFRPHPRPKSHPVATEAGVAERQCARASGAGTRRALGLGGVRPCPPLPVHPLSPARTRNWCCGGPVGPGESVRTIPRCDRSAATCYVGTWIKSLHLSRIS